VRIESKDAVVFNGSVRLRHDAPQQRRANGAWREAPGKLTATVRCGG